MILIPPSADIPGPVLRQLDTLDIPCVMQISMERLTVHKNWFTIDWDHFKSGYLRMKALLSHGHRKIGFIENEPERLASTDRGIYCAMQEFGLRRRELTRSTIQAVAWKDPAEAGYSQTLELLDHHPEITALLVDTFPGASKGHLCSASIPADVRTPDGELVIAFKAGTPPGAANPYGKQINFLYRKPVANGQKYRLSFYYKGSCDGEVVYSPALQYAPYTGFAPKSTETLTVTTLWRKATMEFTVNKSVQPPLAMPRFRLGTFPDGETFYLGPVTLEKVK